MTELGQGIIPTGTEGHLGFILEVPSEGSLQGPSLSNGFQFRVLVHASFGDHEGSGTTELIIILDADDGLFVSCQHGHGGMTGFPTTGFAATLRSMMDLRDGHLKGIVHFKLFVAVEGLG